MSDPSDSSSNGPRDGGAKRDNLGAGFGGGLLNWLRGLARGTGENGLRETFEEVLEEYGAIENALDPEQREMLLNIVSFGELKVGDVMVPRTDIVAVDVGLPLEDVLAQFRAARHSRLPVYRETLDDIVGFLHIKDLINFWRADTEFRMMDVVRDLIVVPPSMPVIALLERMRGTRIHMAIVVDEYGGTDGLVTIEDVVEEIVGDIADEHDEDEEPLLVPLPDGSFDADGRTEIEAFEAIAHVDLLPDEGDEDVDTLGGLVFSMLGRVPPIGERLVHDCGLEFEVVDADARRIKRLKIRRLGADAPGLAAD